MLCKSNKSVYRLNRPQAATLLLSFSFMPSFRHNKLTDTAWVRPLSTTNFQRMARGVIFCGRTAEDIASAKYLLN